LPAVLLASAATLAGAGGATAAEPSPLAVLDRLQATWAARDETAYLALWRAPSEERLKAERDYVAERWSGEESRLEIERPTEAPRGAFKTAATFVAISEPRGRVEQVVFTIEPGADGWAVRERQTVSQIDGLVHLSLGPQAFRADGLSLKLPDFELIFRRGTLFTPPANLGPTALVFVGEATVRFVPGPATEKEQLRQFAGRPELVENVKAAFVRIHPADLHRVLVPGRLDPDPRGEAARPSASTSTMPTSSKRDCRARPGGCCLRWGMRWRRSRRGAAPSPSPSASRSRRA
jgi:hypothetical protein